MSFYVKRVRTFIANNDIPVGYQTPAFPSLYWPLANQQYSLAFLYNISDIWKFTLYWCLILNGIFYLGAAMWAIISHNNHTYRNNYVYHIWTRDPHHDHTRNTNKNRSKDAEFKLPIMIFCIYMLYAGVQGLVTGTVMGFLIGAIYRSGLFAMSTWIPLCCAVASVLFDVVMSYSNVGNIL
ncbi:hypothetical protein MOSE0_K05270 [Monosporozyma servazzii]